ncbi:MAG: hypothetical protein PHU62_09425 [Bacteroidales bacterium]|nr:hypothetical protein [Bacteroidales bacterium]MDD2205511.1 hypothetical protein [Bacteroidales bacterium]MDD3151551.1 hypothetical protein [Bacteroidales bacterium]MDD3914917.1 hypothetical protein [Bacteroidales bacterium]MDD4634769.1 hypothetical protein [Bacteroidales bacterium]
MREKKYAVAWSPPFHVAIQRAGMGDKLSAVWSDGEWLVGADQPWLRRF